MSFNNGWNGDGTNRRKLRGSPLMGQVLRLIEEEGATLIRSVANKESAKIVAFKIGKTPRHVYNLRDGECETGWFTFINMALNYPEVRAALARWLDLTDKTSPQAEAALRAIRSLVANMPEEGDQAQ